MPNRPQPLVAWAAGNRRYDAEDTYTLAAWAQRVLALAQAQQLSPSHPALLALQDCIDDVGYHVGLLGLAPTAAAREAYRRQLVDYTERDD